jgi:hypothetical protein
MLVVLLSLLLLLDFGDEDDVKTEDVGVAGRAAIFADFNTIEGF